MCCIFSEDFNDLNLVLEAGRRIWKTLLMQKKDIWILVFQKIDEFVVMAFL